MSEQTGLGDTPGHYTTPAERRADYWVHAVGIGFAAAGAQFLVGLAAAQGGMGRAAAVAIYAICLLAMLTISAGYNLATSDRQKRRLRLMRARNGGGG